MQQMITSQGASQNVLGPKTGTNADGMQQILTSNSSGKGEPPMYGNAKQASGYKAHYCMHTT